MSGLDGLLAYDANGDGVINQRDEIRFKGYKPGARTDLEGLQAFDTNGDGRLSAADAQWGKFFVWQDINANGVQEAGELKTLAQLGIASLNLSSDNIARTIDGNTVYGIGSYTRVDGSTAQLADVRFSLSTEEQEADPGQDVTASPSGGSMSTGAGNDSVHGGAGADDIFAGSGDDRIAGGAGDDIIRGDSGNDLVSGDAGNDTVFGGLGNDTLDGADGADQLFGGGGADRLLGSDGNDQLHGDDANDALYGGAGDTCCTATTATIS